MRREGEKRGGQYGPENAGDGVAKKDHEPIKVGRGTKKPSLHGQHTLEDKKDLPDNEANEVDLREDMGLQVRKAETLDYLSGGGDGKGTDVMSKIEKFKKDNPDVIDHKEVDELYPKD